MYKKVEVDACDLLVEAYLQLAGRKSGPRGATRVGGARRLATWGGAVLLRWGRRLQEYGPADIDGELATKTQRHKA